MKKTKNEHELIKLRKKRFKKLEVWNPDQELFKIVEETWKEVLKDTNNQWVYSAVELIVKDTFKQKYLHGNDKIFGRFVGQPGGDAVIIIYYRDILEVNMCQKDLFIDHLYYILEHELKHYFGQTHEDMDHIEEFHYPGGVKADRRNKAKGIDKH